MQRFTPLACAAALVLAAAVTPAAYGAGAVQLTITKGGAANLGGGNVDGPDVVIQTHEFDESMLEDGEDVAGAGGGDDDAAFGGAVINRSIAKKRHGGMEARGRERAKSNPLLVNSFDGVNFRQQRLANNGNQFSIEPPDQGLCVGNGYVVTSVNDTLKILDTAGNLQRTVDLNTFYGYAAAINRATGAFGPSITDPTCIFDTDTQRFFHVVLTLDRVGVSSALSGKNHLDIAVSDTANPLGTWTIYRLPVHNDGTDGTPNHGCTGGPCLGDYPHIGTDAHGLYLTTNEFAVFGSGFFGAQVYAISKRALAAGRTSIPVVLFNTGDGTPAPDGFPGFTVWPAHAVDRSGSDDAQFLLSSDAVFNDDGASSRIRLWKITGTDSLDEGRPRLALTSRYVDVLPYGVPPKANQKPGPFPLGQCLSDTVTNCWRNFLTAPAAPQALQRLDASDSRMQQVIRANGKLWAALGTAVQVNGRTLAGIAYFVLNPNSGRLFQNDYIAVENNHVTYPAIAATASGRGVIGFTLVGDDHYPSAGYAAIDAIVGAGPVHVAAEGVGPEDGFAAYRPLSGTTRQRWGDYGAAAVDGDDIWIASEYIGQSCTLAEFIGTGFSCNATRTSFGNWNTRVTRLRTK